MRATSMMRGATALAGACAASLSLCASASADAGPHVQGQGLTPSTCAACHRAHTGKAPYLLKEDQEALCFSCHGSSATGSYLDAEDGVGYAPTGTKGDEERGSTKVGALRGGGFRYALIDAAQPSGNFSEGGEIPVLGALAPVTSSHSINESEQIAWGNGAISSSSTDYGAEIRLTCGSCHDPHGNGMYRILRPIPTESGATTGVEIPETAEMKEDNHTKGHAYTTENYWEVEDEHDPAFIAKSSEWCSTCHTRLLVGARAATTSSGDGVYTYRHISDGGSQSSPSCIQCHVAHGTDATMTGAATEVALPSGVPTTNSWKSESERGINGDSFLLRIDNRGVCLMCHLDL